MNRMAGPLRDSDPSMGDQLTLITQLREQISNMEKQLLQKDGQLLAKDRQVCVLLFLYDLFFFILVCFLFFLKILYNYLHETIELNLYTCLYVNERSYGEII